MPVGSSPGIERISNDLRDAQSNLESSWLNSTLPEFIVKYLSRVVSSFSKPQRAPAFYTETVAWPVKKTRIAYENPWITVREDAVVRPDGVDGIYGVVETRGAAFVVAVDDRQRVALVRIDRHTTGESLEVPAGGLDNDSPLTAAQRELREEAGLDAAHWTPLATLNGLNGVARAKHHVYLASGLSSTGGETADQREEGILGLEWVDFDEALAMCSDGRITDAETVSSLGLARDKVTTRRTQEPSPAAGQPTALPASGRQQHATRTQAAVAKTPWYARDWARQLIALVIAVVGAVVASQLITGLGLVDDTWASQTLANLHAPLIVYALWGPCYLAMIMISFRGLQGDHLRRRLLETRMSSRWTSSPASWASTIVLIALVAVGALVLGGALGDNLVTSIAAALCLVGAWLMMLAYFALEYANMWANGRGIRFPDDYDGDSDRTLRDFMYAAIQINTTFGPGDLQFTTSTARSTVTAQSIVAFLFNTVIIALLIALVV